jgi:hypothetical protein
MQAVDALGVEHQVRKRQLEQRLDLRACPVMAGDAVEAAQRVLCARMRQGAIIHGCEDGGSNEEMQASRSPSGVMEVKSDAPVTPSD